MMLILLRVLRLGPVGVYFWLGCMPFVMDVCCMFSFNLLSDFPSVMVIPDFVLGFVKLDYFHCQDSLLVLVILLVDSRSIGDVSVT